MGDAQWSIVFIALALRNGKMRVSTSLVYGCWLYEREREGAKRQVSAVPDGKEKLAKGRVWAEKLQE